MLFNCVTSIIIKEFSFSTQGQNGSESRIGDSPILDSENLRNSNRKSSDSATGDSPSLKSEKRRIPNKVEKDTGKETSEETHSHKRARARNTDSVGVGSKFTLEDCQRYATYLRTTGQGITNPGGYATTIYRSGEADALIEKFLHPPLLASEQPDISHCPDCHGTGFWYPRGIGGGVKKCKHERLQDPLQPSTGNSSDHHMTAEQITEQATLIRDLLESGYTLEQAKSQFASGVHPDDWMAIQDAATSRLNNNGNATNLSNAQSHNPHNNLSAVASNDSQR